MGVSAMTTVARRPDAIGAASVPISSDPAGRTRRSPTISCVSTSGLNPSVPSTPTHRSACGAHDVVSYTSFQSRSALDRRRLALRWGFHVAGSDHAPDRALTTVGFAHKSGTP